MDVVSFPVPSRLQAFRPLKPKARHIQPPFFEIGKYWYEIPPSKKDLIGSHAGRNGVFDLVTRDVTRFNFYAAAFRKDPVDAKTIHSELEQAAQTGLIWRKTGFF